MQLYFLSAVFCRRVGFVTLRGSDDLIEFSRAIHAEMHAILRGLQLGGEQVKGGRILATRVRGISLQQASAMFSSLNPTANRWQSSCMMTR
jgi:hypothetical protein